ncbi:uncharacterized protein C11orf98 homolog [Ptychodera flava]|uniref:uncharacterized protein C11orf98 homolog n=1 Tax=Ptychodera flava TaxID=63121 RepID=UPI00396A1C71
MPAGGKINRPRKPKKNKNEKRVQKRKKELKRLRREYRQSLIDNQSIRSTQLKKRRTNPRANVEVSGKRKRKLLRAVLRNEKERSEMDVEFVTPKSKSVATRSADVEMKETT